MKNKYKDSMLICGKKNFTIDHELLKFNFEKTLEPYAQMFRLRST
jgi:hypothetical protein